ncbi:MAG TPA: NFACT family protein, partial [Candidatus Eisenbacteria bacterium]|nr:NFACT family protein [Candidatus Eisenbacteria bacterium]
MNSLTLRGVLAEIAALQGQRVDRVLALDSWTLRLDFASSAIVVSVHPRHPTLFVEPLDPPPSASSVPFAQHAAGQLGRGRLVEARQTGLDRVAALGFELRDRLGDPVHRQLIAELTGPAADLVLVEGKTLGSGRVRERLRAEGKERRQSEYTPPASGKMDASQADDADLMAALAQSIATHGPGPRALVHAWQGVSPSIAREILARAAKPEQLLDVVNAWRELLESTLPTRSGGLSAAKPEPTLVTRADGTTEVECFRPRDAASGDWASFSSVSAALRESFRR